MRAASQHEQLGQAAELLSCKRVITDWADLHLDLQKSPSTPLPLRSLHGTDVLMSQLGIAWTPCCLSAASKNARPLCVQSHTAKVLRIAQGETVPYVICVEVAEDGTRADGGGSKGLAERAYHVDEVRGNARLAIETEYYLAHQVPAPQCIS